MIPFKPLRTAIVDAGQQITALVVLEVFTRVLLKQVVEQLVGAGEMAGELLLLRLRQHLAGSVLALIGGGWVG